MSGTNQILHGWLARLRPGQTFHRFPSKSWDRICSVLENVRGTNGIHIRKDEDGKSWEIDGAVASSSGQDGAPSCVIGRVKAASQGGAWFTVDCFDDGSLEIPSRTLRATVLNTPLIDDDEVAALVDRVVLVHVAPALVGPMGSGTGGNVNPQPYVAQQ